MQIIINSDQSTYVHSKQETIELREFVKRIREERGITKSALELEAGLSHPTYSQWEKGNTKSPISGLIALVALGYSFYVMGDGS